MVGRPVRLRTTRETSRYLRGLVTVNGSTSLPTADTGRISGVCRRGVAAQSRFLEEAVVGSPANRPTAGSCSISRSPSGTDPWSRSPRRADRHSRFLRAPGQGLSWIRRRDSTTSRAAPIAVIRLTPRFTSWNGALGGIGSLERSRTTFTTRLWEGSPSRRTGDEILYTRYMNRGSDLMLIENFR